MNPDAALAVVLRQAEWLLADAARDVPAGRLTMEKSEELAEILEQLVALIRQHGRTLVIGSQP